ncbi:MAG: 50S ribosomal protein L9 [Spirochaetales bacterium]|nr:50S ribosomal protein L9 [Spirochaetales bacterium]
MKVILKQDLSNLGEEGDVKVVADGYGRNYLIPKGIAVPYTKANVEVFNQKKNAIEARKDAKRKDAMSLRDRMAKEELKFAMPVGEKGKLFGAITSANIVEELAKLGVVVERKKIDVPDHSIKVVGTYTVKVKLYGGETADLKVVVEASEVKAEKREEPVKEAAPEVVAEPEVDVEADTEDAAADETETEDEA